jgi:16S rRNA (guanine527-N7)-methyltransferase
VKQRFFLATIRSMSEAGEDLSGSLDLSPDQLGRLAGYERLLQEHAPRLGLISPRDVPRIQRRHILDSLRAVPAFGERDRRACDIGSGAGLPGVPLAISLPQCRFVLCEPRRRRAAFLELAVERLGLENAEVAVARAEELPPGSAEVCTARAFAPLEESWKASWRVLVPGGRLVYFAGEGLTDPASAAGVIAEPERPTSVSLLGVVANEPPLVIMTRR